jgi:hypothetical protein
MARIWSGSLKRLLRAGWLGGSSFGTSKIRPLVEIPLAVAAVGTVLAPVLAAVGALAALVTKCKIVVERVD